MGKSLLRITIALLGAFAVSFVLLGISEYKQHKGASDMCSEIKPGMSLAQLELLAARHNGEINVHNQKYSKARINLCGCGIYMNENIVVRANESMCVD